MDIYIDTEFFENGPCKPIELISIGMVSVDGREFYAERSTFDWQAVPHDHWIQGNVRPNLLYQKEVKNKISWLVIHMNPLKTHVLGGYPEIASAIRGWLSQFQDVQFYGYFSSYDWVVFCQIFGRMVDLPEGMPKYCMDLKQMMTERGLSEEWKRKACPDPVGEHNALVDAKWNRSLHHNIRLAEADQP